MSLNDFLFPLSYLGMDELEEFSEAPHVVNNCSISSSSRSTISNQPRKGSGGGGGTDGDETVVTLTSIKANGGNYSNKHNNINYGNHNGYTQKTIVNGGVNLMDSSDDGNDSSEEIVINEFRRQPSHNTNNQLGNGDGGSDNELTISYENNEEDDYEYDHISLSEDGDGLAKRGIVLENGDISTDLLNCDDNDGDLLILTSSTKNGHRNGEGAYRNLYVNS